MKKLLRSVIRFVVFASAAASLIVVVLWCMGCLWSLGGGLLSGSVESYALRRSFWYSCTGKTIFVKWSQIRNINGTWEMAEAVELDPMPLGFDFYIGSYADPDSWTRAGEVAMPMPVLLVLAFLPTGLWVWGCLCRRRRRRRKGFPVLADRQPSAAGNEPPRPSL